jgi:segregation and condensation protein B
VTYGVTEAFLTHFGLESLGDLPGVEELKGAGLLDSRVPANFEVPTPHAMDELAADEDPLEDEFRAELAGDGDAPAVAEDVVITVEVSRDVAVEMPAEAGDEPDDAEA